MRRWNAVTCERVGEPLYGHEDHEMCAAICIDGLRIVFGSADGTVRRWNAVAGRRIGEPLYGHKSIVTCVAVCGDKT